MSSAPTVYFIDDSATMREVIKIAFRRENINVIACHDAASAFAEIEQNKPDVVITDVIMPEKDGYEVCQYIKQHPRFSATPVILMSGVVNRSVAEKAFSVKADELIRKPFQPQDLIARVRHLLRGPVPAAPAPEAAAALSSIFAGAAPAPAGNGGQVRRPASPPVASIPTPPQAPAASTSPLVAAFSQPLPPAQPTVQRVASPPPPAASLQTPPQAPVPQAPMQAAPPAPAPPRPSAAAGSMDAHKLKFEILRLEALVKKLQSELESERQYSRALEEHVKTLQETE